MTPYFYADNSQQTTNASANTDTLLADFKTAAAGHRAYITKLQAGNFSNAIDNQVRLQLRRLATYGTYTSGSSITPQPKVADAPAANHTSSVLPFLGSGVLAAVSVAQIAYNTRGTGMWAAFVDDEKIGMVGVGTAVNGAVLLDSEASGASVAVPYDVTVQE